jgi:hypothetical protein
LGSAKKLGIIQILPNRINYLDALMLQNSEQVPFYRWWAGQKEQAVFVLSIQGAYPEGLGGPFHFA